MIKPGEIQAIANQQQVKDTQIEKDYIITWVLYGISHNAFLKDIILFKGGTVLKKCYFPAYRFSEDLDFTSIAKELDKDKLLNEFQTVFDWVYDESRIRLSIKDTTELTTGNFNFYIGYIGPLGGDGTKKDLKVDISQNEKIYFVGQQQNIQSDYSDSLDEGINIHCYSLAEVIAEKMRTLMERTTPRDLYDLWYLLEVENMDIEDYIFGFEEKADFKGLDPKSFVEKVQGKKGKLQKQWDKFLIHQINQLPAFEEVWRDFNKHLRRFTKFVESS